MSFPGHELRARRLELSLSIDAASAGCAVPSEMIQSLESGMLDRLPVPCYTVGFIRSYCRQLRLEPEYYVSALHLALNGGPGANVRNESLLVRFVQRIPFPNIPRLITSEIHAWVLVIVATVLGWVAYSAVVRPAAPQSGSEARAASIDLRLPEDLDVR